MLFRSCECLSPSQALYIAIQSMGLISSGAFAPVTKAHGEGLKSALRGKPASFTVNGYDHDGEPRLSGGDSVSAVVMAMPGGTLSAAEMTDHQNGSYTVSYLPKEMEGGREEREGLRERQKERDGERDRLREKSREKGKGQIGRAHV